MFTILGTKHAYFDAKYNKVTVILLSQAACGMDVQSPAIECIPFKHKY